MSAAALTAELKRRAADEGFDGIAVARAELLARDSAALERWIGAKRHAGMSWMERDPAQRGDPGSVVPGCRSVVMLAMNYGPGVPVPNADDGRARVARYAHGRDYHRVMGKKLRRLADWLQEVSGEQTRAFVDTGPVLERGWAERTGLGWIGKNANLLTRTMGSWLLLGELLTAAELEVGDGPHADFCGTCSACVDACPTDAIVDGRTVDSNLCISYWTIEHRGEVPEERREGMQDWIFGCDICQEVCPWNDRFSQAATRDPFERREDLVGLDPVEILEMTEPVFRARYSGTPLMRAKWEGMRRNACVVLGNRGRRGDLSALESVLDDPDPVVRSHARWAVARIAASPG